MRSDIYNLGFWALVIARLPLNTGTWAKGQISKKNSENMLLLFFYPSV